MNRLSILNGSLAGSSFELEDEITSIGRADDNDIQIMDTSISRRHANIIRREGTFFIEDLKSHNGTMINGHPVKPGKMVEAGKGVSIILGNVRINLEGDNPDEDMVTRFSIDLKEKQDGTCENILYKNRRITNRNNLELIYEISTILMQSLDITEISEKIMDSLFRCLERIDSGVILLMDEKTGRLKEIIARARHSRDAPLAGYSQTIVNRVMDNGQAIIMSDTGREDKDDLSESIELMRIKSIMCVPLISEKRVLGVIYVHSINVSSGFRKEDLYMLTALSSPAALSLTNALLYYRSKRAEEALGKARDELEERVAKRTDELSTANDLLEHKIKESRQVEEDLKKVGDQLKKSNKDLELAYSLMRESKDRLSMRLSGEEMGLILQEGRIVGITEKTIEFLGMSRVKLIGYDMLDLLDQDSGEKLKKQMKSALTGVFTETTLSIIGKQPEPGKMEAKLMQVYTSRGKMLLVLIKG